MFIMLFCSRQQHLRLRIINLFLPFFHAIWYCCTSHNLFALPFRCRPSEAWGNVTHVDNLHRAEVPVIVMKIIRWFRSVMDPIVNIIPDTVLSFFRARFNFPWSIKVSLNLTAEARYLKSFPETNRQRVPVINGIYECTMLHQTKNLTNFLSRTVWSDISNER